MTLDEAIEHAREVADNWKTQAHHFDGDSSEEANDLKTGCLECAKEHEQLAAWLEELKRYKAQKFVIKVDYDKAHTLKELLRHSQFGIAYPDGNYEVVPLVSGGPSDEELKECREADKQKSAKPDINSDELLSKIRWKNGYGYEVYMYVKPIINEMLGKESGGKT